MHYPQYGKPTSLYGNCVDLPFRIYQHFTYQLFHKIILALAFVVPTTVYGTPAKNAMCIYASESTILRRIFVPDQEEQLSNNKLSESGESTVLIPLPASADACRAAIQKSSGKNAPDPTTAVVVGGVVQQVLMLDPALDSIPAATLVPSVIAQVGDQWDGTKFLRRFVSVNALTGIVLQVSMLDPTNPVNPVLGSKLQADPTAKVGDLIPIVTKSVLP